MAHLLLRAALTLTGYQCQPDPSRSSSLSFTNHSPPLSPFPFPSPILLSSTNTTTTSVRCYGFLRVCWIHRPRPIDRPTPYVHTTVQQLLPCACRNCALLVHFRPDLLVRSLFGLPGRRKLCSIPELDGLELRHF
ncbi:hypothetical protein SAY86_010338 [Trapa natans]|uniref:Uncharacterized protein n=1 Tax=Trapa natans TaxID=22666 RepID=A0AAN7L3B6_TRANT|nr:hypothetical protein SAY86_010338 [Trapa natans]